MVKWVQGHLPTHGQDPIPELLKASKGIRAGLRRARPMAVAATSPKASIRVNRRFKLLSISAHSRARPSALISIPGFTLQIRRKSSADVSHFDAAIGMFTIYTSDI